MLGFIGRERDLSHTLRSRLMDKIDKLCKIAQGIISLDEAISMEEDGSQLCLDCKEAQGWGDSDGHSTPCEICGGGENDRLTLVDSIGGIP